MIQLNQYYQVGGTLTADDPSYVERDADKDIYEQLRSGNFCYVFDSRQMGKSSLQVRVSKRLENQEFKCALISLDGLGTKGVTQEQWYYTFIKDLAEQLELPNDRLESWLLESKSLAPLKRLDDFFKTLLLSETYQNIVIFIDEIDTVLSLDFPTDDFFAFIRSCYNRRANNPNYKRVTFALLGVATPSQLIQDNQRTPFNIGKAIKLKSFTLAEIRPLAKGLESKVGDSKIAEDILQEVLKWTGGQPFLTQKICQLIAESQDVIPSYKQALSKWVDEIVKSQIIENWEEQDNPQHFRTIRDRIINSQQPTVNLLKLYQKIRQQQELPTDDSPEQSELILSGIVVENNRKLKIYNLIYKLVFDNNWLTEILADKKPYEEELLGWKLNKNKYWLLRGRKLKTAREWSHDKILTIEDYQFFNKSQELELQITKRNQRVILLIYTILLMGFAITGGSLSTRKIQSFFFPYVLKPELFSQGERTFFLGNGNLYQRYGVEAFQKGDYSKAVEQFQRAKNVNKNDPEALIYYNNAKAHKSGNYLTLAVAVSINPRREQATDILKGVAQAQDEFNKKGGFKGELLNIIITDDNNEQSQAQTVAQELTRDAKVLGVIGHNGSSVSQAALVKYESAGLAMISATSTSTKLKNKVFFRTVPSDAKAGEKLASYALKNGIKQVVIFYNDKDIYSESLRQAFTKKFENQGGKIVRTKNLADPKLDASYEVYLSVVQDEANAAVFFPNIELISTVINMARAREQQKIPKYLGRNLQLLGGDALYGVDTLKQGDKDLEGLVLAIPWFPEESYSKKFAERACNQWGQGISWRTAASYDATMAFIEAISQSKNPSRQSVLQKLKSITLPANKTSGDALAFQDGEPRNKTGVLVKVVRDSGDKCSDSEGKRFHFEKVD
ncbi:ABC transporter substrate-binding protein [Nostoc sp. CENA67]|uniref:ABC transporter substrate-binding protein n=1 Tax=Amazonocrinis nigriterrae CENA67 TaxID=2794033 RepID=A0A8J7HXY8_9NOST|nr:ABC transporter substrate-binding protein [Amazonocrinis nigriterrae]MBH8565610.1 ABC transporter substrate-binding protein [Amazonocrinis nigriterrae CENA67]